LSIKRIFSQRRKGTKERQSLKWNGAVGRLAQRRPGTPSAAFLASFAPLRENAFAVTPCPSNGYGAVSRLAQRRPGTLSAAFLASFAPLRENAFAVTPCQSNGFSRKDRISEQPPPQIW
jgi:hypothetical protein